MGTTPDQPIRFSPTVAREWDVPVYMHPLELPYRSGRSDYPPSDPTVGGAVDVPPPVAAPLPKKLLIAGPVAGGACLPTRPHRGG